MHFLCIVVVVVEADRFPADVSLDLSRCVHLLKVLAHTLVVDGEDALLLLQLLAEDFDFPLRLGDILPEGVVEEGRVAMDVICEAKAIIVLGSRSGDGVLRLCDDVVGTVVAISMVYLGVDLGLVLCGCHLHVIANVNLLAQSAIFFVFLVIGT